MYDASSAKKAKTSHFLFASRILYWSYIACIPALIIIWTILARVFRIASYDESPIGIGIVIGLLSSVILYAVMKSVDESKIFRQEHFSNDRLQANHHGYDTNFDFLTANLIRPESIIERIAIDNLRRIVANNLSCRPDLLVLRYLLTGYFFNEQKPNWPRILVSKLNDEEKNILDENLYSLSGLEPDQLAKAFGYSTGQQMIDALVRLERNRRPTGLGFSEYFQVLVDAEIKRKLDLDANRPRAKAGN